MRVSFQTSLLPKISYNTVGCISFAHGPAFPPDWIQNEWVRAFADGAEEGLDPGLVHLRGRPRSCFMRSKTVHVTEKTNFATFSSQISSSCVPNTSDRRNFPPYSQELPFRNERANAPLFHAIRLFRSFFLCHFHTRRRNMEIPTFKRTR